MRLTLIRGLPGAGKSTYAKHMCEDDPNLVHVEADQYFETPDGRNFWNAEWLSDAHRRCRRLTEAALLRGHDVVVSNTFTRVWELEPYLALVADIPMADVLVLSIAGTHGSTKAVPPETMERMMRRWEVFVGEIYV
jgi:predicted kinase